MNVSAINANVTNNNSILNQSKNPSFNASLMLSRQASKLLAEKCRDVAERNRDVYGPAAYLVGSDLANYIDRNLNNLAEMVRPLEPVDFPVVIDVSQTYKRFLQNHRYGQTFDSDRHGQFEICPNGTYMDGLDYDAVFNFDFSMLPEQMENLYYVIKDRMDILFNRI